MTTSFLKQKDLENRWFLVDAEGVVLGRLAAEIAKILRGKNKASFTPHLSCGDHIVVINADKIKITGKKAEDEEFFWHTGHPGGIKSITAAKTLAGRFPERVIERAVRRMMPRGPLGREQLSNLRVYAGAEHPHAAQQPVALDLAARNAKNKR
jgi:large subunit ribosomal protein L13